MRHREEAPFRGAVHLANISDWLGSEATFDKDIGV